MVFTWPDGGRGGGAGCQNGDRTQPGQVKKGCVIGWWIVDLSGDSAQEWFVGSVIICPVRLATGIAGIVPG